MNSNQLTDKRSRLREAAQNYQSALSWYQENIDNPNAEQDCDEATAAFKREIGHRETDIIADLLDEIDELQERQKFTAEPVADVVEWHKEGEKRTCDIRWRRHDVAPGPLYTAPPAQGVKG